MRLLVILPYAPSATRVRSRMLLEELTRRHEVTLLALAWNASDQETLAAWRERGLDVVAVPHGRADQLRALAGDPRRPLQQMVATAPLLARLARQRISEAARAGRPYGAAHVEHLRGAAAADLTTPLGVRTVFDAVDCLAALARLTRRHNPNLLVRGVAAFEECRTRRYERALVAAADAVTVVAERDRLALLQGGAPRRITVVPNGVAASARPAALTAAPVAVFTGKLSYHANQAALRLLLRDIWPLVRAAEPAARLLVAGAEPPGWMQHAGRDGMELVANPAELAPLIARARVALAPTVYSVGIQNKVLEALAEGVPVVATPSALAGLPSAAREFVLSGDTPAAFAAAAIRLLRDDALAANLGAAGHAYVRRHLTWSAAATAFEALYAGTLAPASLPQPEVA
ncbi:MAG: glycosyltransferase [Thermomicrobiales bacterium]